MDDRRIEQLLRDLDNGEISEDGMESDSEDIPYYPNRESLDMELEIDSEEENDLNETVAAMISPDLPIVNFESLELPASSLTNSRNLIWRKQSLIYDNNKIKFDQSEDLSADVMELDSPYQFFTYFFTNDFLENIVTETTRYTVQKQPDRPENFTVNDLRKYLGILIFMSVYHFPSTRSYWNTKFGYAPIKEVMPVNKFKKIRRILHFNDNDKHLPVTHPQHDKLHKLRSIIEHLNQKFSSVTIEQRLSIDEQMCATKLGHFLKQYIPNKPHKWGFKLFVLCSLMGYAYSFRIYTGKEAADDRAQSDPEIGVVGQTVLRLLRVVPRQRNHIVYFDNYYTSLPLMCVLAKEGIHSLGTIQRNCLGKACKLPTKQEVMKNSVPRRTYEEYVTNYDGVDITTVSWKDNKQVILASTYVGAEPRNNIQRYDRKEKRKIDINCPYLIKEYNAHMGGVDLMNSYLGRYRIRIKSRKWYIRIFYHLLDLTIINSWILYKKVLHQKGVPAKDILNLADFRSELADVLCKYTPPLTRGLPSNSSPVSGPAPKIRKGKPCQVLPPREVRLDNNGHNLLKTDGRGRCMLPSCSLLSTIKCSKCNVFLCNKKSKDCFTPFHTASNI